MERKVTKNKLKTKSGLGVSKKGKIMCPLILYDTNTKNLNWYGQELPKVGDYVTIPHMGMISKKETGIVSNEIFDRYDICIIHNEKGEVISKTQYRFCYKMTKEEYNDLFSIDLNILKSEAIKFYRKSKKKTTSFS